MAHQRSASRLRENFRGIVKLALASSGVVACALLGAQISGCGSDEKEDSGPNPPPVSRIPLDGFEAIRCNNLNVYDLAPLAEATQNDYVDLRCQFVSGGLQDAGAIPIRILGSNGVACGKAADRTACTAKMKVSAPLNGFEHHVGGKGSDHCGFGRTRGADVSIARTKSDAVAFLGAIDIAPKAWLRAFVEGYTVACGDKTVRPVQDGFEVVATKITSECPIIVTRYLLKVSKNGAVEEILNEEAGRNDHNCTSKAGENEGIQP